MGALDSKTFAHATLFGQSAAVATDSEKTSIACHVPEFDRVTLYVELTAQSTATTVTVEVDASPDNSTWHPLQYETDADPHVLTDETWNHAVSAADTWRIYVPNINDPWIRFRIVSDGDSGDTATIDARFGYGD